ncbi:hypothetical protein, partial [Streptomyces sp. bgisy153]|uniref:hypothetical protein n=1 Tax=Streptomyces sp. bgisy153 TaxID=3413793 RepID=UPI003D749A7E
LANALSVRLLGCSGDVLVGVDWDVDVVEGIGQFTRKCRGPREMCIEDERRILADRVPVLRCSRAIPVTVRPVVGVRLPVAMKRLPRSQLMQPEGMVEQCCR